MVKKKTKPKSKPLKLLIAGCQLWDKATRKAHEGEYSMPQEINRFGGSLYSSGDYGALHCRITGDKAEVTVGSSEGHKTKIDLEKKTLDYYDWHSVRISTMLALFKDIKLNCKKRMEGASGIHCTGITPAKVLPVYRVLVMPTSGDFRSGTCSQTYTPKECELAELKYFRNGPKKEKP